MSINDKNCANDPILTIDEKIELLCGAKDSRTADANGKVPSVFVADGPQGLRYTYLDKETDSWKEQPTSCMPDAEVLAASWNREIIREVGGAIADDCIEHDVDLILAPANNIKRTPVCGRNFEYFSEDPVLAGECAGAYIDGVQEQGIGTSLKHFLANNLERDRIRMSSEIDERTIHEIYGKAFEIAIKHKPWTVMGGYNLVNGVRISHNRKIIHDLLRNEYGFDGAVFSDWGAVSDRVASVKAGLSAEMPYDSRSFAELKSAYEKGELTEREIDECNRPIIELSRKAEQARRVRKSRTNPALRHEIAYRAATEGAVLLKNEGILPLAQKKNIFITGQWAEGNIYSGGGSGHVNSVMQGKSLQNSLLELMPESSVSYVQGFWSLFDQAVVDKFQEAIVAASKADVAIVCVGTNDVIDGEGHDRDTIKLNSQTEKCIKEIAKVNENTVVVLLSGSVIDVGNWIDDVKGLLYIGLAGEACMESAAALLCGKVNPSGKLAESWIYRLEDCPAAPSRYDGNAFVNRYSDGVLVGYRYYDTKNLPVRYPFGFGLSYTAFEYLDLTIEKKSKNEFALSFFLSNVGDRDGKEIVQIYIGKRFSTLFRPVKELKAFDKVSLRKGEKKQIRFLLSKEAFETYSPVYGSHYIEPGDYDIYVCSDSRNIRLKTTITID